MTVGSTIEYDQLVAFLKQASVFEIYRMSAAIQNELENPQRLSRVNQKIKEGDLVEYYDAKSYCQIWCTASGGVPV